MAALTWDAEGERLYETGVDHGVLYVLGNSGYGNGVAWNGLTGVTESPEGADANDIYADNLKYLSLISEENWKGTIKAYTYPTEFNECMGIGKISASTINKAFFGQQVRSKFGFSWRSRVGNDLLGDKYGYKLHIAYGLTAAPSEMDHATKNDSPEATEFSWEISSIPASTTSKIYTGGGKATANETALKPVAHIVILSTCSKIQTIENTLYGTQNSAPTLPTLSALIAMLKAT